MPTPEYVVLVPPADAPEGTSPRALYEWVTKQLTKIAKELKGPRTFDAGNSGAAITINAPLNDITTLTLTADAAITLRTDHSRKGASGAVEFVQDGTGGRVPSFVNLVGDVPTVAAGIGAKTLVLFTNVGGAFVATVLASSY